MGNDTSVFKDGELEEEISSREMNGDSMASILEMFTVSFEELVNSVIRPTRATYQINDLGPSDFHIHQTNIQRHDFELLNSRKLKIHCSFWRPINVTEPSTCIVYAHGNSSSRLEAVYITQRVLAVGFSLLSFDFSGAGMSGGEYVSLGFYEKDDLDVIMNYLYMHSNVLNVVLWGRCVGAASIMMASNSFSSEIYCQVPYVPPTESFKTSIKSITESKQLYYQLKRRKSSRYSIFRQVKRLKGRIIGLNSTYLPEYTSSEWILNELDCKTDSILACKRKPFDEEFPNQINSSSPFVIGLVIDNAYSDVNLLVEDMLKTVSKSAGKRNVYLPTFALSAAFAAVRKSIKNKAGFDMKAIKPEQHVQLLKLPILFMNASQRDFVRPEYTQGMYEKYTGPKKLIEFEAKHGENRPDDVIRQVLQFIQTCQGAQDFLHMKERENSNMEVAHKEPYEYSVFPDG